MLCLDDQWRKFLYKFVFDMGTNINPSKINDTIKNIRGNQKKVQTIWEDVTFRIRLDGETRKINSINFEIIDNEYITQLKLNKNHWGIGLKNKSSIKVKDNIIKQQKNKIKMSGIPLIVLPTALKQVGEPGKLIKFQLKIRGTNSKAKEKLFSSIQ